MRNLAKVEVESSNPFARSNRSQIPRTINPNKTIQLGKKYTEIFPDFASGTTLDLARLIQRWDKKNIVKQFLNLKI